MNGKRQTIWLVSMLSLMVVLSAYYLFTEDSGASVPKDTAGTMQVDSLKKDTANAALPTVGDKGIVVNEVVSQGDVVADEGVVDSASSTKAADDSATTATTDDSATSAVKDDSSKAADSGNSEKASTDTAAKDSSKTSDTAAKDTVTKDTAAKDTAATTTSKTPAKNDKEILDEVASQSVSASSMFTNYLYEREQKNLKSQQDLLALINDMEKTPADNAVAQEQLLNLEEKESKITGIEEQLQQKYGEAIVKEEAGDSYKVVVLSDKLDVKQAVSIVDLVMKELSVSQDKVSVQYVSEK
ncbi:stage III sporulation protein AH [Paenibacillus sp. PastF-3]|jgi:stage III sporulation protein AH|uniref:SpoIIIAH-like family protein n=1 Tax=Paenibacillus sp. PastF-3 TaxID=2940626 RepID=UPI002473BC73|nr:SpoIIIAH-like family protein [Paenibacillus sp. PastF-3]MDH6369792.1 stage III sporulation protein AH [Paenibacillus sp. PastF-3]